MNDAWDFPEEWDGPSRDAIREYLEDHGSRTEVQVSDEVRQRHGCEQFSLESAFFEAKPHPYMVLVRKAHLDPMSTREATSSVVKFSKRQFSLVRSAALKLSTAEHYRTYEGDGAGIRDTDEGIYRESIGNFFTKWNPDALDSYWWPGVTGGSVTYQTDGVWLYCTSLPPRSRRERVALEDDFDADCMTVLGEPVEFARELGSAFAQMSPDPKVSLDDPVHQLQHRMLAEHSSRRLYWRQHQILDVPVERVIQVAHGPVVYTDNPEPLIEAVPPHHRGAAIPFVKSLDYARQREYRFAVSTIGEPAQETVLVPTTPELRELATEAT